MIKKIVILILLVFPLSNCSSSSFNEFNEKAKGDGVPYIPGI